MLKWAVYGKKNQNIKVSKDNEAEDSDPYANGPYTPSQLRRSLDAQTVKKSKKPSRYQRRSIGSTVRKNNLKTVDKENVNYIGNTPNYFKEGFVNKKTDPGFVLKDVSNITPTSATPVKSRLERRINNINVSKDAIPPDLPPTPPTYSRKIREAKKRKLEMASTNTRDFFSRDKVTSKFEQNNTHDMPTLSHSRSEPSLNDLSERLSSNRTSYRNSNILEKQLKSHVSTIKVTNQGLAEIEYDKDLILNCIEKPIVENKLEAVKRCTLPIFGHHIFIENPLYFNKNETDSQQIRPLKRARKKSNEFESCFKSPSVDKKDVHTMVRESCSPISMTPLSSKLAALRFSTMSTHTKSQRITVPVDISECFPKTENNSLFALRDEENSAEMENKFILSKDSTTNVTGSTVSTTQMGDVTLERMIDDIIKSTRKVKTKRRIFNNDISFYRQENMQEETSLKKPDDGKDTFINSQAENKVNLIREAKYVSLSRENSLSPKTSPYKKLDSIKKNNRILNTISQIAYNSFIDDGTEYNEREVKTPDIIEFKNDRSDNCHLQLSQLARSQSMNASCTIKTNLGNISSESTPDLYTSLQGNSNLRLRRQKCIRRKKSTASSESSWRNKQVQLKSILTLDTGIPSPCTSDANNMSICVPLSSSFNCVVGPPCTLRADDLEKTFASRANTSCISNMSHSSSMLQEPYIPNVRKSKELFGYTLENDVPSPITPISNLKRPRCNLSEERIPKTCKVNDDYLMDDVTPIIEHKTTRRCLTFSPEEASINSSEEKRRSIASNRLEKSADRYQGTIDLNIITKDNIIDVHGE